MDEPAYNVLFLCTGNSARSILAEALLNHLGRGRFIAHSAGSMPTGQVNPWALETLARAHVPVQNPRSKSWDEFAGAAGPHPMDLIITVCDNAAGEACPVWPGHPAKGHWGVPDPAAVAGSDEQKRQAFRRAFETLRLRIERLVALPLDELDDESLKKQLRAIGQLTASAATA